MFVTFEGVDGAGKSTQAGLLAAALGPETLLLREPGGTDAGERLRDLLKDGSLDLHVRAELMLFCAARAQLVEERIRPALAAGRDVVCDRFIDSTVAYQGFARGLGSDDVNALNELAIAGCRPDRTVLLEVGVDWAADRARERQAADPPAAPRDRFESEGIEFQRTVADAFRSIAAAEPERFLVVDAEGDVQEVHERVRAALGR